MLSVDCITKQHKKSIEAGVTDVDKNRRLINILFLSSIGDYKRFILCVIKTYQYQAACLLDESLTRTVKPVNEVQKFALERNHTSLTELLDSRHGLLSKMYQGECITSRQKDFIELAALRSESNARLLTRVERSSESNFRSSLNSFSIPDNSTYVIC